MRLEAVPEAEAILIELGERPLDRENLIRVANYVVGGKQAFLESVARRAKYGFLLWEVVSGNHFGWLPKDVVYEGRSIGWDTPYRVVEARPDGEIQVTPNTAVSCRIIQFEYGGL